MNPSTNPFAARNLLQGLAVALAFCTLFAGLWIITP